MKTCVTTVLALVLTAVFSTVISGADETIPTDFDILARLCSEGIVTLIQSNVPSTFGGPPKTAFVSYSGGLALSAHAKETVAAALTRAGFSTAIGMGGADYVFTVTVTDARIVCALRNGSFDRSTQLTVHVKCLDAARHIMFAERRTESYTDTVPKNALRSTQNAAVFSQDLNRHVLRPGYNKFRIVSLTLFAAVLAYFAFE